MDIECVSLLPRVCEVLADSQRSLPDDTSLEKLLDWLTRLTDTGVSLLESCPCLTEFITTVINNTDLDPSILSFTLKLTGLMASSEDGFRKLQECLVLDKAFHLQHWQEAELWDDPCIRIGWIQGLKNLLQHPKALSFFLQSDFIDLLLQLQTDTSLFVASAANQVLAHILLFFQPVSSAGCNGVDKTEKVNGNQKSSHMDVDQPAVTTETSAEHSAVLKLISEHLKQSLVPQDNAGLHQSLQSLKLLALLLPRAGRPLRDKLLRTVSGSLEEVVMSDCSRLTLPLMDVILAAYSSSRSDSVTDQRVGRLLSSMLNINKPSDLIQAAAALLRSGHQDASHSAQAARMLLLPLDVMTGHALLGSNTSAGDHWVSMAEQLKSKTSCISLICICLTHVPHITLLPPDILPCPPASVVTAVLSLLNICCGVSSSSASSSCSEARRHVISCGKVQKCALEALTSLSSIQGSQEKISEVFRVLIEYLKNPDSDPTVLHKSFQALLKWMRVCTDSSFMTEQMRGDLGDVVRKRVCDMRWEVRDSTVEFLGNLADLKVDLKSAEEDGCVSEALLGDSSTTLLLREALQDTESYVRASAVCALAKTLTYSWQQGATLTQDEAEIVRRLLEILSQDTEGFPRRAVLQYFITWFSSSSSTSSSPLLMQSVSSVLSQGSSDLDWEVKVHTLELAELLMDKEFSGQRGYSKDWDTHHAPRHPYAVVSEPACTPHTHTEGAESDVGAAFKYLVDLGVVSALLSGLVDCDRPVGLKACRLLIRLREMVCPLSPGTTVPKVSCDLPVWGWGLEIRRILGLRESTDMTAEVETAGVCVAEGAHSVTVDVCEVLTSLGLDERLDVLTRSSDHIHNSPLSLLQDILTARAAYTQSDTEGGQEVIVDCY